MGSLSLIIVLILVVWIIVLAPMLSGGVKKIRRSGEVRATRRRACCTKAVANPWSRAAARS